MKIFLLWILLVGTCFFAYEGAAGGRDSLLKVVEQARTSEVRIQSYLSLARIYERTNNDSIIFFVNKALALARKDSSKEMYLEATSYAASLLLSSGMMKRSIDISFEQLALAQSLSNYHYVSNAYSSIAYTYNVLRLYDKSLEYYFKTLALVEKRLDTNSFTIEALYLDIGIVYKQLQKPDSAIFYFDKAIMYGRKLGQRSRFLVLSLAEKLNLYATRSDTSEISSLIAELKARINPGRNSYVWSIIFLSEASNALGRKDFLQARMMADSSLKRAIKARTQERILAAYNCLYKIHYQLRDFKEAAENKNRAFVLADSLYSANTKQQAVYAAELYASVEKEKAIASLEATTKQQRVVQGFIILALLLTSLAAFFAYRSYSNERKMADVLARSNNEKEVFLKEIHHRVKNNLQIISSLLYMQFKDTKDEMMVSKLKQAQERIKSMALVHNKLYESDDVVHVYLREYVSDLASGILASNTPSGKLIGFEFEGADTQYLSLDASISLGLILNELITNSCKYAFKNQMQGEVTLSASKSGNTFTIIVSDNGSGLPDDFETRNSLGIRLVKNLARQMRGSAKFYNNNGTTAEIVFKDLRAA